MGPVPVLVRGEMMRKPGSRRHKGPEAQSSYLNHLHSSDQGLPWTAGQEVIKATLI